MHAQIHVFTYAYMFHSHSVGYVKTLIWNAKKKKKINIRRKWWLMVNENIITVIQKIDKRTDILPFETYEFSHNNFFLYIAWSHKGDWVWVYLEFSKNYLLIYLLIFIHFGYDLFLNESPIKRGYIFTIGKISVSLDSCYSPTKPLREL